MLCDGTQYIKKSLYFLFYLKNRVIWMRDIELETSIFIKKKLIVGSAIFVHFEIIIVLGTLY